MSTSADCRFVEQLESRTLLANTLLAFANASGQMLYTPDAQADRIIDFSQVGYRQGLAAISSIAVKATVAPGAGDDGARIQAAIDQVSALPLDKSGFRGTVLLKAGEYQISGTIKIRASGVVLRGEGNSAAGTILRATGTSQRALIDASGTGSRQAVGGTTHNFVDKYVPVGARSFRVDSTSGLAVGDTVVIHRPSTAAWINALGMDKLANPWTAGSKELDYDRVITRIEGNWITVDAPLAHAVDTEHYGGATIYKYTWSGRIRNVGIEQIRGISDYASLTDENHSWTFIRMNAVEHGWVRSIIAEHFANNAVTLGDGTKWVTVERSDCLDPISKIEGGRRYSFNNDGQLNLLRTLYARNGRHDFVNGSLTSGPNVFVDAKATRAHSDTGPHHRYSTGGLFDNVIVSGTAINVQNRGNSGTGHGWAGANMVVWNSTASGGFVVQNPPGAQNWLIGSTGTINSGTMYVGPHDPGIYISHNTPVTPRSLYYQQLAPRQATPGLSDREYWLGDIDNFYSRGNAGNAVYVDSAWRAAVDAATAQPLHGFDQVAGNHWVPFTFAFNLEPGMRIVHASLSLGLKSSGGLAGNDVIYVDSLKAPLALSSLPGGLPGSAGAGRVIDLGTRLATLADGKLNLALQDDTSIDWAVLNLRVAPIAASPAAASPAAPAAVVAPAFAPPAPAFSAQAIAPWDEDVFDLVR